jgi:hypothetical protein
VKFESYKEVEDLIESSDELQSLSEEDKKEAVNKRNLRRLKHIEDSKPVFKKAVETHLRVESSRRKFISCLKAAMPRKNDHGEFLDDEAKRDKSTVKNTDKFTKIFGLDHYAIYVLQWEAGMDDVTGYIDEETAKAFNQYFNLGIEEFKPKPKDFDAHGVQRGTFNEKGRKHLEEVKATKKEPEVVDYADPVQDTQKRREAEAGMTKLEGEVETPDGEKTVDYSALGRDLLNRPVKLPDGAKFKEYKELKGDVTGQDFHYADISYAEGLDGVYRVSGKSYQVFDDPKDMPKFDGKNIADVVDAIDDYFWGDFEDTMDKYDIALGESSFRLTIMDPVGRKPLYVATVVGGELQKLDFPYSEGSDVATMYFGGRGTWEWSDSEQYHYMTKKRSGDGKFQYEKGAGKAGAHYEGLLKDLRRERVEKGVEVEDPSDKEVGEFAAMYTEGLAAWSGNLSGTGRKAKLVEKFETKADKKEKKKAKEKAQAAEKAEAEKVPSKAKLEEQRAAHNSFAKVLFNVMEEQKHKGMSVDFKEGYVSVSDDGRFVFESPKLVLTSGGGTFNFQLSKDLTKLRLIGHGKEFSLAGDADEKSTSFSKLFDYVLKSQDSVRLVSEAKEAFSEGNYGSAAELYRDARNSMDDGNPELVARVGADIVICYFRKFEDDGRYFGSLKKAFDSLGKLDTAKLQGQERADFLLVGKSIYTAHEERNALSDAALKEVHPVSSDPQRGFDVAKIEVKVKVDEKVKKKPAVDVAALRGEILRKNVSDAIKASKERAYILLEFGEPLDTTESRRFIAEFYGNFEPNSDAIDAFIAALPEFEPESEKPAEEASAGRDSGSGDEDEPDLAPEDPKSEPPSAEAINEKAEAKRALEARVLADNKSVANFVALLEKLGFVRGSISVTKASIDGNDFIPARILITDAGNSFSFELKKGGDKKVLVLAENEKKFDFQNSAAADVLKFVTNCREPKKLEKVAVSYFDSGKYSGAAEKYLQAANKVKDVSPEYANRLLLHAAMSYFKKFEDDGRYSTSLAKAAGILTDELRASLPAVGKDAVDKIDAAVVERQASFDSEMKRIVPANSYGLPFSNPTLFTEFDASKIPSKKDVKIYGKTFFTLTDAGKNELAKANLEMAISGAKLRAFVVREFGVSLEAARKVKERPGIGLRDSIAHFERDESKALALTKEDLDTNKGLLKLI